MITIKNSWCLEISFAKIWFFSRQAFVDKSSWFRFEGKFSLRFLIRFCFIFTVKLFSYISQHGSCSWSKLSNLIILTDELLRFLQSLTDYNALLKNESTEINCLHMWGINIISVNWIDLDIVFTLYHMHSTWANFCWITVLPFSRLTIKSTVIIFGKHWCTWRAHSQCSLHEKIKIKY